MGRLVGLPRLVGLVRREPAREFLWVGNGVMMVLELGFLEVELVTSSAGKLGGGFGRIFSNSGMPSNIVEWG